MLACVHRKQNANKKLAKRKRSYFELAVARSNRVYWWKGAFHVFEFQVKWKPGIFFEIKAKTVFDRCTVGALFWKINWSCMYVTSTQIQKRILRKKYEFIAVAITIWAWCPQHGRFPDVVLICINHFTTSNGSTHRHTYYNPIVLPSAKIPS